MKERIWNNFTRQKMIILGITLYWSVISIKMEKYVFNIEYRNYFSVDYFLCKVLQLIGVYLFCTFIYRAVICNEKRNNMEFQVLKYAFVYMGVLIIACIVNKDFFYKADELNIYNAAINYSGLKSWFNYPTGYFYIISIMTIPLVWAPVIIKLTIQALVVGYVTYRVYRYFQTKWAYLIIVFFCTSACLEMAIAVHRMPIYGMIYLFLMAKLLFDYLEEKSITSKSLIGIAFSGALLTMWRSEGIYMFILVPILVIIAYRIKGKTSIIKVCLLLILVQGIVYCPQAIDSVSQDAQYVAQRMRPFYNYVITNMCRNGLDRTKNKEDLEIVDKYVSIEAIDILNKDFGDIAYLNEFIFFKDGYIGVEMNASIQTYINYTKAMQRIIVRNPFVYIKAQVGAWNYISTCRLQQDKSIISNIFDFFAYQLYIPTLMTIIVFMIGLIKKKWIHFFIAGGAICHATICTLLLPAADFKYYLITYLIGYFYLILLLIYIIKHKKVSG